MKLGSRVKQKYKQGLEEEHPVWIVIDLKSNAKGIWIKLNDDFYPDTWHDSSYYEVINEV